MPTPPDLDQRLRAAAGAEPDTERALSEVLRRVRRRTRQRTRQRFIAVAAMLAIAGGLVAAWIVERRGSDEPSVVIEQPTTTTSQPDESAGRLRQLWSAPEVGMSGGFAPQAGQVVVPADETVFTANGFGVVGQARPIGRIAALDRETGSVRWRAELDEEAWLQGVAGDIVVANTQHERIVGLDAATGAERWEISLSELGLDGYGAVRSAVGAPRSAIGLSANFEGDVRPPVILGIDTDTGEVVWTTALAEGTDLTWGTPPVRDGATVFLSTLSHPGSAEENGAHLIGLADGTVRWTVGLGGGQGFSEASAIIRGPYVHLPAFPDVVTVDRSDGRRLWDQHGWVFVSTEEGIWTVADDGALALLDADTGDVVREVDSPVEQPVQLLDLDGGLVGVVSHTQFSAIDTEGEVQVLDSWPPPLVEVARSERDAVIVATEDQTVTAYEVEAL